MASSGRRFLLTIYFHFNSLFNASKLCRSSVPMSSIEVIVINHNNNNNNNNYIISYILHHISRHNERAKFVIADLHSSTDVRFLNNNSSRLLVMTSKHIYIYIYIYIYNIHYITHCHNGWLFVMLVQLLPACCCSCIGDVQRI